MSFRELHLDRAIVDRLHRAGYREPTPVQAQAIPTILEGRDIIALAATGTGKTAAFIAPLAQLILRAREDTERKPRSKPRKRPASRDTAQRVGRALIIEPTRELAQQVADEAVRIVGGAGLHVACAFGGVGIGPQAEELRKGGHMLIATPGRVRDLVDGAHLSLDTVAFIVLDEADRLLDMGLGPQVEAILRDVPRDRQAAMFTATMPADLEALAEAHLSHPVRLEVGRQMRTVEHVEQHLFPVMEHLKAPLLLRLLQQGRGRSGVLIFTRTRRRAAWVATALQRNGIRCAAIHGDRTQPQRRRALEQFREGELDAIVATDVAARGLHIEAVRTVVNYDLPGQGREYVHRVGRAGHGGAIDPAKATGESITLLDPRDRAEWSRIETLLDMSLRDEMLEDFDYDEARRGPARRSGQPDDHPRSGRGAERGGHDKKGSRKKAPRRSGRSKTEAGTKPHEPPKITTKPKRRHGAGRPVRSDEKPGGGVAKQ